MFVSSVIATMPGTATRAEVAPDAGSIATMSPADAIHNRPDPVAIAVGTASTAIVSSTDGGTIAATATCGVVTGLDDGVPPCGSVVGIVVLAEVATSTDVNAEAFGVGDAGGLAVGDVAEVAPHAVTPTSSTPTSQRTSLRRSLYRLRFPR
jgi:TctA family transporter